MITPEVENTSPSNNKSTILFLHGAGSADHYWEKTISEIHKINPLLKCISLSLFPYIKLPKKAKNSVDNIVRQIVIDLQEEEDVWLVGHSAGGLVALKTLKELESTDKVKKVFLLGSVNPCNPTQLSQAAYFLANPLMMETINLFTMNPIHQLINPIIRANISFFATYLAYSSAEHADDKSLEQFFITYQDPATRIAFAEFLNSIQPMSRNSWKSYSGNLVNIVAINDLIVPPQDSLQISTYFPRAINIQINGGHMMAIEQPGKIAKIITAQYS